MLPGHADLCKLASKLESKKLKGSKFHPDFMSELEALLLDVYASLLPTASDYEQRKQLIYAYDMTVKNIFGNTGGFPVVEAFGSFVMNIFTANSDLDLSINFSSSSDAACLPRDQMKAWAKANDINSSKDHTMNSLTIISLVAFHFQTRDPPILPPFSTLLRNGTDITNLRNVVLSFKNFGARNKESVAELFVALLAKLSSIEKLWELGLCASIFEGSWMSKTWNSKVGNMSIEDFLDRSQNFARSVGKFEMTKIYDCLRGSLELLSRSMKGQIEFTELRSVLFGSISFNTQSNRVKTKAAEFIKHKLPIQSVQPIVDVIDGGDLAKRRKKTRESAQAHVDTIVTTNHANSNATMTLKRKLTSNEPLVTPSNHSSLNSTYNQERKPPAIELSQRGIKMIAPKKARNSNIAATSTFGSHHSQRTRLSPSPIIHPTLLHVPPQPIGVVGYPHMSFHGSGHPFYRDPVQPVHTSLGHRPYHYHSIYPSQHPMAHVHPAYGPQGPHNFPNPMHPLIHGYPIDRRENPHHPLPSRGFWLNHV